MAAAGMAGFRCLDEYILGIIRIEPSVPMEAPNMVILKYVHGYTNMHWPGVVRGQKQAATFQEPRREPARLTAL